MNTGWHQRHAAAERRAARVIPGTLGAVLGAWPLVDALVINEVFGGATNRVFKVEGSHGVAFLRCYKRSEPALVQREHALIQQAQRAGIPAARPLEARGGGTFVQHDGRIYALYEAAVGEPIEHTALTALHARAAGDMLGRLQRALAALPDVGYLRWALDWDGDAWCERLTVVERAILARASDDETDGWALRRVRAQRAWLAEPDCRHRYQPESRAQVTHGDYQDANLFFDARGVSGVIDWEQAAFMPRAYEVVRACSLMFQLEPERTRALIAAYSAAYPLSDAELADAAIAWGVFSDHHVWPVEQVYLHGNDSARRYIPHLPFRPFEQAWASVLRG